MVSIFASTHSALLLMHAFVVVLAVRLGLWLLPFRLLQRTNVQKRLSQPTQFSAQQIAIAVTRVAAYVPHASCLTQALAAHILLAQHGYLSHVRIGVAKDGVRLAAHAWLEHEGEIVIGNVALAAQHYTILKQVAS
jgi:Transglutaminase-like superfamily